jgi:hypothetical protein
MTKQRAPLTFERALIRIADLLGWEKIAEIAGKDVRTVRNWSDPDTAAGVTLDVAELLDVAYQAEGGEGAPFLQCYALRLEKAVTVASADAELRAARAAAAAKESGEAVAALVMAARPGATSADRAIARRETEEAISALTNTLSTLDEVAAVQSPGGENKQNV